MGYVYRIFRIDGRDEKEYLAYGENEPGTIRCWDREEKNNYIFTARKATIQTLFEIFAELADENLSKYSYGIEIGEVEQKINWNPPKFID